MLSAMSEYPEDLPVLNHVIHTRKAFANAAGSGRSVLEMKLRSYEKPASEELTKLVTLLFPS